MGMDNRTPRGTWKDDNPRDYQVWELIRDKRVYCPQDDPSTAIQMGWGIVEGDDFFLICTPHNRLFGPIPMLPSHLNKSTKLPVRNKSRILILFSPNNTSIFSSISPQVLSSPSLGSLYLLFWLWLEDSNLIERLRNHWQDFIVFRCGYCSDNDRRLLFASLGRWETPTAVYPHRWRWNTSGGFPSAIFQDEQAWWRHSMTSNLIENDRICGVSFQDHCQVLDFVWLKMERSHEDLASTYWPHHQWNSRSPS